jgi:hypothetical protein
MRCALSIFGKGEFHPWFTLYVALHPSLTKRNGKEYASERLTARKESLIGRQAQLCPKKPQFLSIGIVAFRISPPP